jgi:hypothetical protein
MSYWYFDGCQTTSPRFLSCNGERTASCKIVLQGQNDILGINFLAMSRSNKAWRHLVQLSFNSRSKWHINIGLSCNANRTFCMVVPQVQTISPGFVLQWRKDILQSCASISKWYIICLSCNVNIGHIAWMYPSQCQATSPVLILQWRKDNLNCTVVLQGQSYISLVCLAMSLGHSAWLSPNVKQHLMGLSCNVKKTSCTVYPSR